MYLPTYLFTKVEISTVKLKNLTRAQQNRAWIHTWAIQLEALVEVKCLPETHVANEQKREETSLTEGSGSQWKP